MGFAAKVLEYVTHKRGVETKESHHAQRSERAPEANLPEFLDEEAASAETRREESEGRLPQWRPRPIDDDFPLSG